MADTDLTQDEAEPLIAVEEHGVNGDRSGYDTRPVPSSQREEVREELAA